MALRNPDRPSILTDEDPKLSPWITPERIRREGMLVVWNDRLYLRGSLVQLVSGRPVYKLPLNPAQGRAQNATVYVAVALPEPN